jgi:hypothetical protein
MIRDSLNRTLVPEHEKPEVVSWSDNLSGRAESNQEDPFTPFKKLVYHGLSLTVGVQVASEETYVYLECRNDGPKAVGFGVEGFGLVLSTGEQRTPLACKDLTNYGKEERRVMMDTRGSTCNIAARFGAISRPDSAEVIVQANRILAAPLLFHFAFDLRRNSSHASKDDKSRPYRLGDSLWGRKNGITATVDAIEDGVPFSFMQYDPDDKRLVGGWRSFLGHVSGPRRTFTWIFLWNGSEWVDCEPPWEHGTPPPQSLLKTLAAEYLAKRV